MAVTDMPDDENYDDLSEIAPDMPTDELVEEILDGDLEEEVVVEDKEPSEEELAAKNKEAEEEPEPEEYGKKVGKRISKLVYERNSERDLRIAAEAENAELRKNATTKADEDADAEHQAKIAKDEVDREGLLGKLNDAYEEGDAKEIANVTGQLSKHDAEAAQTKFAKPEKIVEEKAPVKKTPLALNNASQTWIDKNDWFNDRANARIGAMAESIETDLRENEGYELGEDLYKELDKRLLAAAPRVGELRGKDYSKEEIEENEESEASEESPKPKKPQSVVSGQSSGDAVIPAKPKAGVITKDDLKAMKKYGFDPNSAADRKGWLNRNAQL